MSPVANELWEETKRVLKDMYGKRLSEAEFAAFLLVAQKLGLDPVAREIIPQVREGKEGRRVAFIVSRDGYLKAAMRDPGFAGLQSMVVREGDTFEVHPSEGRVIHRLGSKRGAILGAWAIAYHKERPPVIFFADFTEYFEANKESPTWRTYPSAMIQKVAEVGALRRQFTLSGVVAAEEVGAGMEPPPSALEAAPPLHREEGPALPAPSEAQRVKELLGVLGLGREEARRLVSRIVEREVQSFRDLEALEVDLALEELERLAALPPEKREEALRAYLAQEEVEL
ncbi:RecT family recombinase [Thermus scotoductus]